MLGIVESRVEEEGNDDEEERAVMREVVVVEIRLLSWRRAVGSA